MTLDGTTCTSSGSVASPDDDDKFPYSIEEQGGQGLINPSLELPRSRLVVNEVKELGDSIVSTGTI